jgi:hypothetical protein
VVDLVDELEQHTVREDRRYKHKQIRRRQYVQVSTELLLRAAKEIRRLREKAREVHPA